MSDKFTVEPAQGTVVVRAGGAVIAESTSALVLRETGYDPVYYLPRDDAGLEFMERSDHSTTCPHKGTASYYNFLGKSQPIANAAWSYEAPIDAAAQIAGHVAFDTSKMTVELL